MSGSTLLALAVAAAHPVPPLPGGVQILDVPPIAPGGSGELSVTILDTPTAGTPIELSLAPTDVVLADNRLGWPDVVDPQAVQPRLRARFTAPREPGRYDVHGKLRWLTCNGAAGGRASTKARCVPRTATVRWSIEVRAPEADVEP